MLELFLAALEDQLGLLVNPPLAPIARMNVISLEITRLIRAAELPLERNTPIQAACKHDDIRRLGGVLYCKNCGEQLD